MAAAWPVPAWRLSWFCKRKGRTRLGGAAPPPGEKHESSGKERPPDRRCWVARFHGCDSSNRYPTPCTVLSQRGCSGRGSSLARRVAM